MSEETHTTSKSQDLEELETSGEVTDEEAISEENAATSEENEATSEEDGASAEASKKRRISRKIRRYEVPIEGAGDGSQTILRFKPLGFWKMFFAVMLGFFTSMLLFLAATVLAVIILGGVLWGTVKDRVGDWVVDIADQVSEELDQAQESVSNIADRVDESVNNASENVDSAISQAGSTASSVVAQSGGDSN